MNSKIWPFVIALLIAGAALFGTQRQLQQQRKAMEEQFARGPLVYYVTRPIERGEKIKREDIRQREVPERFVPDLAVSGEDSLRRILGQTVNRDIKADDFILWSDLEERSFSGLAGQIPQNMRAYTFSPGVGVRTDLIKPNDHVDILGTFALPAARPENLSANVEWQGEPEIVNIVLLQDVTVLGVGANTGGSSVIGSGGSDVTIAVTLRESQLLMFASQYGELGAVLRRNQDFENLNREVLPKVTFDSVVDLIGELDGRRKQRIIETERVGGATETVPIGN